jgi:hypothetical protein
VLAEADLHAGRARSDLAIEPAEIPERPSHLTRCSPRALTAWWLQLLFRDPIFKRALKSAERVDPTSGKSVSENAVITHVLASPVEIADRLHGSTGFSKSLYWWGKFFIAKRAV